MTDSRSYAKTRISQDVQARAVEEFAEYFPKALETVDQSALRRMGVSMPMMVDVFRSVYTQAFVLGAIRQLEELADDQPRFTAETLAVMRSRERST